MLKIHSVAIQCCAEVGRIASQVARKDAALADQMRRAKASVALNISECVRRSIVITQIAAS